MKKVKTFNGFGDRYAGKRNLHGIIVDELETVPTFWEMLGHTIYMNRFNHYVRNMVQCRRYITIPNKVEDAN